MFKKMTACFITLIFSVISLSSFAIAPGAGQMQMQQNMQQMQQNKQQLKMRRNQQQLNQQQQQQLQQMNQQNQYRR